MQFFADWIRNLFLSVAAVSFLELLTPQGELGNYLKFIFSLVLLAMILWPLTALLD